jgi:hypothetical protein
VRWTPFLSYPPADAAPPWKEDNDPHPFSDYTWSSLSQ